MTPPPFVLSPPLLFATDGSPSARMAQQLIRPIAEVLQAQLPSDQALGEAGVLTIMTVQPRRRQRLSRSLQKIKSIHLPSMESGSQVSQADPDPELPADKESSSLSPEQLTELVQSDFPQDFPLSIQVRQGRPATEILNCARTIRAGLIAVGHRGVGGMRELLLGSVSTAIARYAPCSVLVTRCHDNRLEHPVSLAHVLLVVDQASTAQDSLLLTQQLVPAGIQTVTLLHIQAPLNASYLVAPFVSRTPSWQLNQSLQDAQREQGEQILQAAVQVLATSPLTINTRLQTGDAGPSICQVAAEIEADLIILGSDATRRSLLSPLQTMRLTRRRHEPGGGESRPILRNTRLSITEDYVIHYAPCPVMLCRARTEAL